MRTYISDALVLRTYRYGEADRIVVFLTEDRGKKRGVAKNATTSRRRFGAALEPLTLGRVAYVERETRELVRVDRIEPKMTALKAAAGRPVGEGAQVLGHAAYFAELIDEWSPECAPNERLFRLGAAMSDALCRTGSIDALARYFEYWLLKLEGVYPALVVCPRCGQPTLGRGAWLAQGERALVCLECGQGRPRLSPEAMACVRGFARQAPADAAACAVSSKVLREVEGVHDCLMALHLEQRASIGPCGEGAWTRVVTLQDLILKLSDYWSAQGCLIQQPLDVEMGAGTMHPETFLRVLGSQRWNVAYVQPSRRPADGRFGENPEPALQAPPVPGDPQARARRRAGSVSAEPRGVRDRPARARRPLRGGQLGVADARRVGHRLAGAVRRPGDHAVHVLPAGRAASTCRRSPSS